MGGTGLAFFGSGEAPQVQLWLHPIAASSRGPEAVRRGASELARRLLGVALAANHISVPADLLTCPALALFDVIEEQSGIAVSLSHCRGLVLAGLAPGPIGVDCEMAGRNRNWPEMASMYFSTDEANFICSLQEDQAETMFLRHWTLKESMVKAIRGSVWTDLNRLIVDNWTVLPAARTEEQGTWYAWQGEHAGCSVAMVCALPEPPDLRLFVWPNPRKPDEFADFQSPDSQGFSNIFKVL